MPHTIRLRRPWIREETATGTCWRRRFNRPTGLTPPSRVWVCVAGLAGPGEAALNGARLGSLAPDGADRRFDATQGLALHNELILTVDRPLADDASRTCPPGEVRLEIET